MNVVSWGAEIFGGRPDSVGDEEPVINKLGYKLEACDWLPYYEPYKLRADHPYYRDRAESANDELAELRSFKEAAIKRFPELAPVDPDEKAAQKFAKEWHDDDIKTVEELARAAIAWARANPR